MRRGKPAYNALHPQITNFSIYTEHKSGSLGSGPVPVVLHVLQETTVALCSRANQYYRYRFALYLKFATFMPKHRAQGPYCSELAQKTGQALA